MGTGYLVLGIEGVGYGVFGTGSWVLDGVMNTGCWVLGIEGNGHGVFGTGY